MKDEIKEILVDNDELIVRYKDNSFESFDTLPKNVLDYITNLQEENEKVRIQISAREEIINKAIEYFKYQLEQLDFYEDTKAKMLCAMGIVILQGEDKDVKD